MHKEEAKNYILDHIKHVLPRLAADPSIFPNREEAKQVFYILEMNDAIHAIDDILIKLKQNQEYIKIFNI